MCGSYCASNEGGLAEAEVWHKQCVWSISEAVFGLRCHGSLFVLSYEWSKVGRW